jgi:signal transduction histidine kinase
MSFLQQLIQLLTEAPGSIVYHLVTLISIQAALGLALWQWRHNVSKGKDSPLAKRMVWGMSGILLSRLAIIIAVLLLSDQQSAVSILPPLEQAIDTATVAIIVWLFTPHISALPLLGDVVLLILLLFTAFMYAFFAQAWVEQAAVTGVDYVTSDKAFVWHIFQISLLFIGAFLVLLARWSQWGLRLSVLFILLLAHAGQILTNWSTVLPTDSDIAYWVRLGNLLAFPLLAIFIYRHNLIQLLTDQANYKSSAEQLSRHLQLSRSVIESLDINHTLQKSLQMAADLVQAEYTALAVVSHNDPGQLHLVSDHSSANGASDAAQNRAGQQKWALNLVDWPAIRLAMQQQQRVELIPNGLGARQLFDFYKELGVHGLGSLLIEPLLVAGNEIGVLLLAGPADLERWSKEDKSLSFTVAAFLARAIQNARRYEQVLEESGGMMAADETVISGRLIALEEELKQAQSDIESWTARWRLSDSQLTAEIQRARELEAALERAEKFNRDERVISLEKEVESLRESLIEAEEAMALAAAGEGGLSPEWVTMTITRYSAEVEDAMLRIQQLESKLARQEDSHRRAMITSLAQELRTPLTSLSGYSDLLLGESMGILGTKQMSLMRRIKANTAHMSALLEQLIQLSNKRVPPSEAEPHVDIRETIETAINSISSNVRDKNLRIDLDLDQNLPAVASDGDSFYQIVVHLLNNACQVSTIESRILISAHYDSIQETSLNGDIELFDFLHLAVTDSGFGLSQEIHEMVLDANRQAETVEISEVGQSLSTAVSLINAQGGRFWLSKEWETGDTLSVLLPLSGTGYAYSNGKPANAN